MTKFDKLLEIEGMDDMEMFLEEYGMEGAVPGICMTPGCEYSTFVEPDQDRGWCEECNKGTVKSGIMLLGII